MQMPVYIGGVHKPQNLCLLAIYILLEVTATLTCYMKVTPYGPDGISDEETTSGNGNREWCENLYFGNTLERNSM